MKKLAVLAMVLLIAGALAGCSSDGEEENASSESQSSASSEDWLCEPKESESINCVVVYGNRANSKADPKLAADAINQTFQSNGYFGIVRLDGEPACVAGESIGEKNGDYSRNQTRRKAEEKNFINNIGMFLRGDEVKAKAEEVDVVAAIKMADRCLESAPDKNRKNVVVVVDSGISTKGLIDFTQEGMLSVNPEEFVQAAISDGQLGELSNIDEIRWFSFGDVSTPQERFKDGDISLMQSIYREVLLAAGVSSVKFSSEAPQNQDSEKPSDLPHVSTVEPPVSSPLVGQTVSLKESDEGNNVRFKPESAEFKDDSAARETLSQYIQQLKNYPNLRVKVEGYTARYKTEEEYRELAQRRADRVKQALVEGGANVDQIEAIGVGWGTNGIDVPEGAAERDDYDQQNRCVVLSFYE